MKRNAIKISRPADAFLPASLWIATLLGRGALSLWLFIAYLAVKLCALGTSSGLRNTFALQPSVRSVQGSGILALLLQLPGAIITGLIAHFTLRNDMLYPLIACGFLLNIEHVFYEYLFAIGEDQSAMMYRAMSAVLTLTGLLLCAPSSIQDSLPPSMETAWLLATSGIAVLIGLVLSLTLGGKPRPRMNSDILRRFPIPMLQAALYPVAALTLLRFIAPSAPAALPLFSGLILYELCRSPFRRTPAESWPMNRALLVVCVVVSIIAVVGYFLMDNRGGPVLSASCLTVILAALCAFALFGNINLRRRDEA